MRYATLIAVICLLFSFGCKSAEQRNRESIERAERQAEAAQDLFNMLDTSRVEKDAVYVTDSQDDDFEQTVTHRLRRNWVPHRVTEGRVAVDVNTKVSQEDTSTTLVVRYEHEDWLFIAEGQSLTFLIDDSRLELIGSGSEGYRETFGGGRVQERSVYSVSPNQLRQIASADTARFRLSGRSYHTDRSMSESNKKNIIRFLEEFDL